MILFLVGALGIFYEVLENKVSPLPLPHELSICFTPNKKCQALLLKTIKDTKKSLKVQAYSLKDEEVIQALITLKKEGKDVQVLLDKEHLHGKSKKTINDFKKASIEVKIEKTHGLSHNKVMIVDERLVVTGSYNFSVGAYKRNSENILLINDSQIAKSYLENFEKLWGK
ncbi:MAG TPA: phospholipase D-like domain-containing protein [Alphaproteobacteria bacterium]|nr:phospholipase D-like domain-containing protein [Alphaproteobacteria bacterium]